MSRWSFKNVPVLCGSNYLRCVADRVLGLIRGSSAKRWIVFYWKLSRWLWCLWQYVAIVKITWLTFLSSWCQLRECHAGFDLRCNLKSSIGRKPWEQGNSNADSDVAPQGMPAAQSSLIKNLLSISIRNSRKSPFKMGVVKKVSYWFTLFLAYALKCLPMYLTLFWKPLTVIDLMWFRHASSVQDISINKHLKRSLSI